MWSVLCLLVFICCFRKAISDCVDGLISERYSGDVSETDNGLTCQAWANFPEYTDSMFPVDGSVTEASNFCRNFDTGSNIPWCYTTDPDIKFGRCGLRICFGHSRDCGAVLRSKTGNISPPDNNGDGFYDNHVNCLWKLEAPENLILKYRIHSLSIEATPQCLDDALLVFESGSSPHEDHILLCGDLQSYFIDGETKFNILYVNFWSDGRTANKGFTLTFVQTGATNKVCNETLTSSSGWIASPDFDDDGYYDHYLNCFWTVHVKDNDVVFFQVLFVQIQYAEGCLHDYLEISDDIGRLSLYCGFGDEIPSKETRTNAMLVHFRTNNFISFSPGFNMTYTNLQKTKQLCGEVIKSKSGFITSPDYDNDGLYDKNVDCLWTIQVEEGHFIRYMFQYIYIEDSDGCTKDTLWTYEEGSDDMIAYCGSSDSVINFEGETSSNVLHVRFRTDASIEHSGFNITFVQENRGKKECGGFFENIPSWISSPDRDGDGQYDFNLLCHWTFEVAQTKSIKFQFLYILTVRVNKEEILCLNTYDFVKVVDPPIVTTWCGTHFSIDPVITSANRLDVYFASDNQQSGVGFNMTLEEVERRPSCNHTLEREEGWISSPDYDTDGLYDGNLRCQWTIQTHTNRSIELELLYVILASNARGCQGDVLVIDERYPNGISLTLCGFSLAEQAVLRSRTNIVYVTFHTDFVLGERGFLIHYQTIPGQEQFRFAEIVTVPGWLASPDIDGDFLYDLNVEFFWLIDADDGYSILMQLLYIDIEASASCRGDFLMIDAITVREKLCGVGTKIIFMSETNFVLIKFQSDFMNSALGFLMKVSQIAGQSKQCGGHLTSPTHYIAPLDRNEDGFYDHNLDCQWSVLLEIDKVVVFEVLEMDIQKSAKCSYDSLRIYEEHVDIGKYCGLTPPLSITTETNLLYLRFISDGIHSGKGFLALYFQSEDAKDCLQEYKCHLSDLSLPRLSLCDNYRDCPHGDDERFCYFRCPPSCSCIGLSVDCSRKTICESDIKRRFLFNNDLDIPVTTRWLDVSTREDICNNLKLENQELIYLLHLNLSGCGIANLSVNSFRSMTRLTTLDLSYNSLRLLKSKMFETQTDLVTLYFVGNSEPLIIEPESFAGLSSLQSLTLSELYIRRISRNTFASLTLKSLKIYHSYIDIVESHFLGGLYSDGIFFNSSTIATFSETMFEGSQGVKTFVTDNYKFCCVRPFTVAEDNCYPHMDDISSCDDLIGNEILRPLIWIIGMFTLISNIISIVCRFIYQREQLKHSYGIFVSHLALSDFLMGVYLIIVAGADILYRGKYIFYRDSWIKSTWCKLAGTLSTLSSEASVLFICLITLDRLLAVKYPFGQRRLSLKVGHVLAIIIWIASVVIAVLPISLTSLFNDEFYSQSGVCLALPLTRVRVSGWAYSVGVFIVFNTVSCLLVAVGQWFIYSEIKTSKKACGKSGRSKSSSETRMAWNLLLVVTTDFLCWLPIGFLGILASVGLEIHGDVFSWIAVVILPINSAVNPILYTLSAVIQKMRAVPKTLEQRTKEIIERSKENVTTADLEYAIAIWNLPSVFWLFEHRAPGYNSLSDILGAEWFDAKRRLQVARDTAKRMCQLHNLRFVLDRFTADDVFVQNAEKLPIKTAVVCRPKIVVKQDDYGENISALRSILSDLVKEIHVKRS